jgi:hypothetical protein
MDMYRPMIELVPYIKNLYYAKEKANMLQTLLPHQLDLFSYKGYEEAMEVISKVLPRDDETTLREQIEYGIQKGFVLSLLRQVQKKEDLIIPALDMILEMKQADFIVHFGFKLVDKLLSDDESTYNETLAYC